MLFYAGAHLGQLFYYCYVGQQLSHEVSLNLFSKTSIFFLHHFQSGQLTDAIYLCEWHLKYDKTFRKALTLMMQRSQRKIRLTAVGLLELDFSSFVKVRFVTQYTPILMNFSSFQILRLSFSFYTLLDSISEN